MRCVCARALSLSLSLSLALCSDTWRQAPTGSIHPKVYINDFCSRPRRARPDTVLTRDSKHRASWGRHTPTSIVCVGWGLGGGARTLQRQARPCCRSSLRCCSSCLSAQPNTTLFRNRCRANMAHVRQSRPDSGLGFQVKFLNPFKLLPSRSALHVCLPDQTQPS